MLNCALLDDYQSIALESADWSALAGRVRLRPLVDPLPDRAARIAALADCEIVVAMRERTPFDRDLLAALPKLKLLVTTGMVNAAIDLDACRALGITVCGTSGAPSATPELTWALILALARHVPEEVTAIRAGGPWQQTIGIGLAGKRLGLIGLGKVGARVARVGAAFGMLVDGWSRSLTDAQAAAHGARRADSLEQLLSSADIVSVHVPLTAATRGLLDRARLSLMKPSALLVNTSRGPIVEEAALLDALHGGRIAGAALDVFEVEPLPADHPFRSAPRLLCTPHLGYVTRDSYKIYYGMAVENIAAWLDGAPVRVLARPA